PTLGAGAAAAEAAVSGAEGPEGAAGPGKSEAPSGSGPGGLVGGGAREGAQAILPASAAAGAACLRAATIHLGQGQQQLRLQRQGQRGQKGQQGQGSQKPRQAQGQGGWWAVVDGGSSQGSGLVPGTLSPRDALSLVHTLPALDCPPPSQLLALCALDQPSPSPPPSTTQHADQAPTEPQPLPSPTPHQLSAPKPGATTPRPVPRGRVGARRGRHAAQQRGGHDRGTERGLGCSWEPSPLLPAPQDWVENGEDGQAAGPRKPRVGCSSGGVVGSVKLARCTAVAGGKGPRGR
ncbi:hypothetical protein HaLaN_31187, partial [Haematococcus lacustris]